MEHYPGTFAALTATFLMAGTLGVGCGGRLTASESGETGGSGGSAQTGGSAGNGGTGGSTGGTAGTGGSTGDTGGSGGSTGGTGGAGGSTGGTGGTGGSTGGTGGSTGGSGGGAGRGGTGGTGGGTTPPGTVACGTSICTPITSMLGTLPPCCPMDTPNACGGELPIAQNACFTATPGVTDPRCPTVQVMGFPLSGCCRPNRMCGVSLQPIGLGCNDPVAVGGMPAGRCGTDL